MRVRPTVAGAVIRDPVTRMALPAEGGDVPNNSFWQRRLMAGEVVLVSASSEPTPAPVAPLTTREG